MASNSEHFFHIFVGHLHFFFFEKYLFRSFGHFKIELLLFLSFLSSLYILDINPLSDKYLANIFSHFVHSVDCFFGCTEDLQLEVLPFVNSCFCFLCLQSLINNSIAYISCVELFPLCFLLVVSGLMFRFLTFMS
jgi:hypothetical protein